MNSLLKKMRTLLVRILPACAALLIAAALSACSISAVPSQSADGAKTAAADSSETEKPKKQKKEDKKDKDKDKAKEGKKEKPEKEKPDKGESGEKRPEKEKPEKERSDKEKPEEVKADERPEEAEREDAKTGIEEDGWYYDLESVVIYYDTYGKLPGNFVTKKEAKETGWEGGKIDGFIDDAAIGGDHFGNYEKRLPAGKGIKYIECDIDTKDRSRGAKRLIISDQGKYYYTDDHYETFSEVIIKDGSVSLEPLE